MKKIAKSPLGWFNENLIMSVFLLFFIIGVAVIINAGYLGYQHDIARTKVISSFGDSDVGKFAARYLKKCYEDSFLPKNPIECAKEVIEGARVLQGDGFAREVGLDVQKIIEAGEK